MNEPPKPYSTDDFAPHKEENSNHVCSDCVFYMDSIIENEMPCNYHHIVFDGNGCKFYKKGE
jgi:hypothetical protein